MTSDRIPIRVQAVAPAAISGAKDIEEPFPVITFPNPGVDGPLPELARAA